MKRLKYLAYHVLSKLYRLYSGLETKAIITYGRFFKKGDPWIAKMVLRNVSAEDGRALIVTSRISQIAEGMRGLLGLTPETDHFSTFFGMQLRGEYIPPEIGFRLNYLFKEEAVVADVFNLWLELNQYRREILALANKVDPIFFEKFLQIPIAKVKGFAIRQEDYDKL